MRLLLVEDDEDKREQLLMFFDEHFTFSVDEVRSFQSALKAIKTICYDLIILDMTIPTYDISPIEQGGRAQAFGGEMLLHELKRRHIMSKAIVVTQFDLFGKDEDEITLIDLDLRLMKQFPINYLGAIQYNIKYTSWESALLDTINKIK